MARKSSRKWPKVGEQYTDAEGRKLVVIEVDRKLDIIRGVLTTTYSTSQEIWSDIWRDKQPALPASKSRIG